MKYPKTLIPRDFSELSNPTGNAYEAVVLISKHAQQINEKTRKELDAKLDMFAVISDNLEEVFENREQIEVSKSYEKKPKPTTIATEELLAGQLSPQYAATLDQ